MMRSQNSYLCKSSTIYECDMWQLSAGFDFLINSNHVYKPSFVSFETGGWQQSIICEMYTMHRLAVTHLKSLALHITNLILSYPVKILGETHMKGHDLIRKFCSSVSDNTQSAGFQVSSPIVCRLKWFSHLQLWEYSKETYSVWTHWVFIRIYHMKINMYKT